MGDRAWLVRPNVRGRNRLPAWLREGYCAIGWYELGEVPAGTPREVLAARIDAAYPTASPGARRAWVGNLDRFLNGIDVGDLVVTPDGRRIYVGEVSGPPRHVERHEEAHRRDVRWIGPDAPLDRHELSDRAQAKLRSMLTVCDLTGVVDELTCPAPAPPPRVHPRPACTPPEDRRVGRSAAVRTVRFERAGPSLTYGHGNGATERS